MIGRVHDRRTFQALERLSSRARRGPVSAAYVRAPSAEIDMCRVAFGVGRKMGRAVTRNKVRRRLRQIMRELDRQPGGLVPGAYLVTVQPAAAELSYAELRRCVSDASSTAAACAQDVVARTSS